VLSLQLTELLLGVVKRLLVDQLVVRRAEEDQT